MAACSAVYELQLMQLITGGRKSILWGIFFLNFPTIRLKLGDFYWYSLDVFHHFAPATSAVPQFSDGVCLKPCFDLVNVSNNQDFWFQSTSESLQKKGATEPKWCQSSWERKTVENHLDIHYTTTFLYHWHERQGPTLIVNRIHDIWFNSCFSFYHHYLIVKRAESKLIQRETQIKPGQRWIFKALYFMGRNSDDSPLLDVCQVFCSLFLQKQVGRLAVNAGTDASSFRLPSAVEKFDISSFVDVSLLAVGRASAPALWVFKFNSDLPVQRSEASEIEPTAPNSEPQQAGGH